MPRIEGDFTKISSSFQPLEDGDYQFTIESIEEGTTRESQLPQLTIMLRMADPNHPEQDGYPLWDRITLRTKKQQPNRIGLGQLKAYAEAVLGEEAANNSEGIDTDELIGGSVMVSVKLRNYVVDGDARVTNEVKKVTAVR